MKYIQGQTAYIVESNRFIREVTVSRVSADFYVVRFTDTGGAIQVRGSRLFATEEEARASILPEKKHSHAPYEYWH